MVAPLTDPGSILPPGKTWYPFYINPLYTLEFSGEKIHFLNKACNLSMLVLGIVSVFSCVNFLLK